jgi:glycosyltransferase involved in cell wall biosynthesis
LVHLKASQLSHYVIPTKTLAYLAAGKPILMAMQGAAAQLVTQAGAGMVVPPGNPELLAAAIHSLRAMSPTEREVMGRSGQDHLKTYLAKQKVISQYEQILQSVASPQRVPP